MLTTISKDFRWEMGHRLPDHEGACRNIHGHSYRMWVELTGEPDQTGMVLDYFVLKQLVDPLVAELDHAFLCHDTDSLMVNFLKVSDLKAVYVPFATTAEHIAAWFFERLSLLFARMKHLQELRVRIQETERTSAEVGGKL